MPLLLIDNLNLIFDQLGQKDLKRFRSILQEENFVIIVATALSVLDEISNYEKPFYDFFEIRFLDDLNEEEIEELVKKKLDFEGKKNFIRDFEQLRPRIKALAVLTGGNPRLILMMCDLLCKSGKMLDIEMSLLDLLDELTPFYQAKMETFSNQQRVIFDTLALGGQPLTPTMIARKTNIEAKVVIVQLKRLEESGYVERIKLERTKTTRYEIKERLFRIWREMRSSPIGSKRIQLFIKFLKLWYRPEELYRLHSDLMSSVDRAMHDKSIEEMRSSAIHAYYVQEALGPPAKNRMFLGWVTKLAKGGEFETIEKEINARKDSARRTNNKNELSLGLVAEGIVNSTKGDVERAMQVAHSSVEISPNNPIALSYYGLTLADAGRYDEALQMIDRALKSSKTRADKHFVYFDKSNVLIQQSKYQEALRVVEESLKIKENCVSCWVMKARILGELNDAQQALNCAEKAIELEPSSFMGWYARASILDSLLHNQGEAMKSLDEALRLDPDNEDVLDAKAHVLLEMGKEEEASEAFHRTYNLAKEKGNRLVVACSAIHIMIERLSQSLQSVRNGDFPKAQELLNSALNIRDDIDKFDDSRKLAFRQALLEYLADILRQGTWQYTETVLRVLNENLGPEHTEFLNPLSAAIEYVKTRDLNIIESLQKEVRQVVVSIIRELSPSTPIPKELK
jgi:tetratricopeptide (TPR) repeat protein/predicted transcriptional regulator